ncbi:MAG: PIN domain-containing protein, partial [Acidobacteriota bacterium]
PYTTLSICLTLLQTTKKSSNRSSVRSMIIADTGFWLALANRRDRHHGRAAAWLRNLDAPLICTWPVVTETVYLLLHRVGALAQRQFLESHARGAFEVFDIGRHHVDRLVELMEKYEDLPMDLADASLVLLSESLGHGRILSTDERDFGIYRCKQQEPFENLLSHDP